MLYNFYIFVYEFVVLCYLFGGSGFSDCMYCKMHVLNVSDKAFALQLNSVVT